VILAGNQRYEAAKQLKLKTVPVFVMQGLTEDKEKEIIIRDNISNGDWNWDILASEWDDVKLEEWGLELQKDEKQLESKEDDYTIPDEIKTDIVLGDLFEIGEHRLLCGNCTDADDVCKLLNGKEPYLMVADPPYGVVYDPTWRHKAGINNSGRQGKVQNDDRSDWTDAWVLSPCRVAYIWHGGKHTSTVQDSLERADFEIRAQIIWNKQQMVFSRGDYHWKHEPCWYAVKKGNKGNWAGDRRQTTVWDIQSILQSSKTKPEDEALFHGTQKPVECMARPISNHDGDVYDPFLGSGTTMVASYQLNRKCYGMEIDPKYCQIILERMLKLDDTLTIKRNGEPYILTQE
jgi:DNA modification methylase